MKVCWYSCTWRSLVTRTVIINFSACFSCLFRIQHSIGRTLVVCIVISFVNWNNGIVCFGCLCISDVFAAACWGVPWYFSLVYEYWDGQSSAPVISVCAHKFSTLVVFHISGCSALTLELILSVWHTGMHMWSPGWETEKDMHFASEGKGWQTWGIWVMERSCQACYGVVDIINAVLLLDPLLLLCAIGFDRWCMNRIRSSIFLAVLLQHST